MKTAILFPGQGAQYFGMGADLYHHYSIVKEIYKKADELLEWRVSDICFGKENELIHQTRYTQAALFATNYAIYKVLETKGIKAEAMLGFSLGEYDAIAASGALDFEQALQLVDKRAFYMEQCSKDYPGGMSAVIGMEVGAIKQACETVTQELGKIVEVANDNCKGQVTIAGEREALEKAGDLLKSMGARRVLPLKVSGAFHTSLMQSASNQLKEALSDYTFKTPQIQVISNVTASPIDKEQIIENIPLQITHGVRFRESIEYLVGQGFDTFIEVGPKCTLTNLVKKIDTKVNVFQVEDCKTLENLIEHIGGSIC